MNTQQFDTLVEALEDLQNRGYTRNFNLETDTIQCKDSKILIKPEEFEIMEVYRFEGMTDPSDSSILYAIESEKYQLKGVLVNAYGVYSDTLSADLAAKLKVHH